MSLESQSVMTRLRRANARAAHNPPKDLFYQRFALTGVITDNATTAADLTASGALKSEAIMQRLGVTLPAADPTIVMSIERMGITLHGGVETDLVLQAIAREVYVKHTPANDRAQTIDLGGYLTSALDAGRNGVIATGGFGSSLKKPETYELEVPLLVDMQRDALVVAPHVAVDSAANVPFTLWVDAWCWHNRGYVRSDFLSELEGDDDQAQLIHDRAKASATREYRKGKNISAIRFPGAK